LFLMGFILLIQVDVEKAEKKINIDNNIS